ncbi:MAG: hypothetical protein HY678_04295, partial [Chloroflexi bacterium]|nr:hypothetical protein [Chloroflexota bacterium]
LEQIVQNTRGKTALIGVRRHVALRREAARCYEAEIKAAPPPLKLLERSPLWIQKLVFSRIALTRLVPAPVGFERDLFPSRAAR